MVVDLVAKVWPLISWRRKIGVCYVTLNSTTILQLRLCPWTWPTSSKQTELRQFVALVHLGLWVFRKTHRLNLGKRSFAKRLDDNCALALSPQAIWEKFKVWSKTLVGPHSLVRSRRVNFFCPFPNNQEVTTCSDIHLYFSFFDPNHTLDHYV